MSYENSKDKGSHQRNLLLSAMPEKKMKVIALTGVIGAGKSSVIAILRELGISVIDCDDINEQLQQPQEEGYRQIIKVFGEDILDADLAIDKAKLGSIVFHDEKKKQQLEAIMHPLIQQRIRMQLEKSAESMAIVEVPLLFEIHWESYFDEIWVVVCQEDILLERLREQRHVAKEEALLRMAHQWSQEEKMKHANHILHNDTSREDLKKQIIDILRKEDLYAENGR